MADSAAQDAGAPRNVLFICADDMNGWIGPLGRCPGRIYTPRIDELAQQGTVFTNAYCTAPHCNPSRASVFSGQRPSRTGVYLNEHLQSAPDRVTLPEQFLRSGFEVFGAGKVFHGVYDYATATRTYAPSAEWSDTHNDPSMWSEFHPCSPEPLPDGRPFNGFFDFKSGEKIDEWYGHFDWGALPPSQEDLLPDLEVAAKAIEFLERPHDRPFFCAVGFYRPHLPWYVPQRFFDLYPLDEIVVPDVRADELDQVPAKARDWALKLPDHEMIIAHDQWHHAVRGYLASMSFVDELIGRVVAGLRAAGLGQNTTVVLWGDNGFHLGEKLHWRKMTLWEEATRVPLIVCAPGISQPGYRFDSPVSLLDLYPTLLELTNQEAEGQLDGESLVNCLRPGRDVSHALPVSTWGPGNHSVRENDWRFTHYADGSRELYDHRSDPRERINLAYRPEFADKVAQLAAHLDSINAQDSGEVT